MRKAPDQGAFLEAFRTLGVNINGLLRECGRNEGARAAAFEAAKSSIRNDFKMLCFSTHPDRFISEEKRATERFKATMAARDVIEKAEIKPLPDPAPTSPRGLSPRSTTRSTEALANRRAAPRM